MTELRAPLELRPHPDNAAIYGEARADGLIESIRRRGVLVPLLVTRDGRIVSGHRRLRAALALGLQSVPVEVYPSDDELDIAESLVEANRQREKTTEQKTREFTSLKAIEAERAKRRQLAGVRPDADLPANLPEGGDARDLAAKKVGMGARTAERAEEVVAAIDGLEAQGERTQAAALRKTLNGKSVHGAHAQARKAGHIATPPAPAPPPPTGAAANTAVLIRGGADVPPEAAGGVLYLGHGADRPGPVHLIVTSPPYAVRVPYADGGDVAPEDYRERMHRWMRDLISVTAPSGRLALNVPLDTSVRPPYPTYAIAMEAAMRAQWHYQFAIVWNEGNVSRSVARGSVDSASAPHVIAPVEMVAVFAKHMHEERPDGRLFGWQRTAERPSDLAHAEWLEWTNGLWTFSGESRPWEDFPAAFPVELPRRLIKLLSFPGDTVLDPFMGSGTTAVAALQLGRCFIGFDRSARYVDSALRRLQALGLVGTETEHVEAGPGLFGAGGA